MCHQNGAAVTINLTPNASVMHLIRQLEILGKYAENHIPYLNRGGCCVYAAHVANRISELNIPVWGVGSLGLGHVMIRFWYKRRLYTHDSSKTVFGRVTRDFLLNRELVKTKYLPYKLMELAEDSNQWCSMFNRDKYIPEIIDSVGKLLSDEALYVN
jgi:hypothetical protein